MAKKNPQRSAEKWSQRLAAAGSDISDGVKSVSEAPGQAAARAKAKWAQGIQQAIADGTWEEGVSSVSLQDWQRAFMEKALPRIAQGAQSAKGDMAQFMAELSNYQEQLKARLANMPDTTPEDRIQYAIAWMRGMREFRRQR